MPSEEYKLKGEKFLKSKGIKNERQKKITDRRQR